MFECCDAHVIRFHENRIICFSFTISSDDLHVVYFKMVLFSRVVSILEMRFAYFLVAFLLDDVKASLSGLTRFVLNRDTNPTNQPINSSGDDRNVATARYESQEVILAESGPMAPENKKYSVIIIVIKHVFVGTAFKIKIRKSAEHRFLSTVCVARES